MDYLFINVQFVTIDRLIYLSISDVYLSMSFIIVQFELHIRFKSEASRNIVALGTIPLSTIEKFNKIVSFFVLYVTLAYLLIKYL